jgi:hypothetical protein
MDVFISWSKERSHALALAVAKFLPLALPQTEVFISDAIPKGERWDEEIHRHLKSARVGIACVTGENVKEAWLMYEAGAIAGALDRRLIPLLLDVAKGDLGQPLGGFQACEISRDEMRKLCSSVNDYLEKKLPAATREEFFDAFWPRFEASVNAIKAMSPSTAAPQRGDDEKLDELVQLARIQDQRIGYLTERASKEHYTEQAREIMNAAMGGLPLVPGALGLQLGSSLGPQSAYQRALSEQLKQLGRESASPDDAEQSEPPVQ